MDKRHFILLHTEDSKAKLEKARFSSNWSRHTFTKNQRKAKSHCGDQNYLKKLPPPLKLTACPWKSTVGRCDSFWDQNLFSGALAVSFRKCNKNAKIQFDGPETLLGHRKVTLRFCTWWRIPSSALEKLTLSRWKSKAVGFWLQGGQIHQKQRWSMESCWWFFHVHLRKHLFEDVT